MNNRVERRGLYLVPHAPAEKPWSLGVSENDGILQWRQRLEELARETGKELDFTVLTRSHDMDLDEEDIPW